MADFYNDNEPYVVEWLKNLIQAGLLPEGDVDGRNVEELTADDVQGRRRVHLFAGIGGWPYALSLAGWPDDREVWTASLPCPSFSAAGKRRGVADERHLWPVVYPLIQELRPATIFGEQVEAAIGFGWLDGICADLEREGYACGAAVLPAASVGAPHIRQRLYWVAHTTLQQVGRTRQSWQCATDGLADAHDGGAPRSAGDQSEGGGVSRSCGTDGGLGDADLQRSEGRSSRSDQRSDQCSAWAASEAGGLGNPNGASTTRQREQRRTGAAWTQSILNGSGWVESQLIQCLDGKVRRIPIEPRLFPLADVWDRSCPRVAVLRAAGNAIVPQVAAEFIKAVMDVI